MNKARNLRDYAQRRFIMAGGSILREHNPYCVPVDQLAAAAAAAGRPFTSFANYDYLGLSADPRVRTAAAEAALAHGPGVGASRLVGGERSLHRALEADLAAFLGVEDALVMVSGYGTNFSLLGHLLTAGDLVLVDEYSHNSILAGTQLSRAAAMTFAHNDLDELAALLERHRHAHRRVLVVVEGLYSMDGDIPDLPRLEALCARHDAWLAVDEAHSMGVLGTSGRGIAEHYGLPTAGIDLVTGTLSKAFCSCGGFVAGARPVIEWLRYSMPGFVYSVGVAPPAAAAAHAALRILQAEPARVAALGANSRRFLEGARAAGLDVGSAVGAGIVPVMFPSIEAAMGASQHLLEAGFYVPPIVQLGVPKDKPRLRFFLSAAHTEAEIDGCLARLAECQSAAAPPAATATA